MLSGRLVRLIEDNWEEITERVIRQIRWDAKLYEIGKLSESELRLRSRAILQNLGARLTGSQDELLRCQEELGRERFEEGTPLHEIVHALQIIKDKVIQFGRDRTFAQNSLEIYAEEELEHSVNQLFDRLIYSVVRGYERAMREAALRVAGATMEKRSGAA